MTTAIPSPSRELPPNFTVVEVGVGSHPFPLAPDILEDVYHKQNTAWSFTEGRSYTGVDRGMFDLDLAAQNMATYDQEIRERRPGENIRFILGDILDSAIDVAPGSVNELLLTNVLSSFETVSRLILLQRAAQLLVAGGQLVMRENFMPTLYHPGTFRAEARKAGFQQINTVSTRNNRFEALTDYYGPTKYDLGLSTSALQTMKHRYFGFALTPEIE